MKLVKAAVIAALFVLTGVFVQEAERIDAAIVAAWCIASCVIAIAAIVRFAPEAKQFAKLFVGAVVIVVAFAFIAITERDGHSLTALWIAAGGFGALFSIARVWK